MRRILGGRVVLNCSSGPASDDVPTGIERGAEVDCPPDGSPGPRLESALPAWARPPDRRGSSKSTHLYHFVFPGCCITGSPSCRSAAGASGRARGACGALSVAPGNYESATPHIRYCFSLPARSNGSTTVHRSSRAQAKSAMPNASHRRKASVPLTWYGATARPRPASNERRPMSYAHRVRLVQDSPRL
jgi:hypothetical protein